MKFLLALLPSCYYPYFFYRWEIKGNSDLKKKKKILDIDVLLQFYGTSLSQILTYSQFAYCGSSEDGNRLLKLAQGKLTESISLYVMVCGILLGGQKVFLLSWEHFQVCMSCVDQGLEISSRPVGICIILILHMLFGLLEIFIGH